MAYDGYRRGYLSFAQFLLYFWLFCHLNKEIKWFLICFPMDYIEINPSLVENTGNISRGSCKSCKQTSAHARVCLQVLQLRREIFPVFLTKGRLIYILHLQ